ncbi:WD40 repeat-like protein [Phialemonium atrogriseum]|uniref:WD40 repeat-like protein n=1 Tax=Phialemonium atrogriseum TaxID=1093897 RepID=A0AAJ0BTN2_9PEZI|nr:WD40 repeat-like protein [Phialemonium atrogriseum]KAK1764080.1 WD40 repeat-like protein [Phialemonium atrogriseum]
MPPSDPHHHPDDDSEPEMLAEDDALEEIEDGEGDIAMDSDNEDGQEEITLHNDSIAYFDQHKDSVFTIAQHPKYPSLIATGGSEGDSDDAPGKGYVFDTSAAQSGPVLPPSYNSDPTAAQTTTQLEPIFAIEGHTDSINALAFTQPNGEFLASGGMDGRLRVYSVAVPGSGSASAAKIAFLAESQEVPEINWLAPCPSATYPNTIALGASDGSVWVYTIDASDASNPVQIIQSYFLHMEPCTAGAWSPDGQLLATVAEDSSLYVWDVWGAAAAKSLVTENGQTVVALTAADQRFAVEGGLYSVAVSPSGTLVAVGGAGGFIKVVGLPRLSDDTPAAAQRGARGAEASSTHAGTILASLHAQSDSIESLAFAPAPATLLAAGSVDGSVAVYDAARGFSARRHLRGAHDDFSVVRVEFVRSPPQSAAAGWLLTSCGMDGVVRRWDLRVGSAPAAHQQQQQQQGGAPSTPASSGLVKEWRGHRGDGEGGGVLGFVQGETGERVVTAGDDGLVLVFEA